MKKKGFTFFSRNLKISKMKMNMRLNGKQVMKDNNPACLGVKLDRSMKMYNFMSNIKNNASKWLNVMKCLSLTARGSNKTTMRRLYLGYIKPAIDFALPLQDIARTQAKLSSTVPRIKQQNPYVVECAARLLQHVRSMQTWNIWICREKELPWGVLKGTK